MLNRFAKILKPASKSLSSDMIDITTKFKNKDYNATS